jgi:hypothetical protein
MDKSEIGIYNSACLHGYIRDMHPFMDTSETCIHSWIHPRHASITGYAFMDAFETCIHANGSKKPALCHS